MADDDEEGLRLNSLDRFRKRSPRLLLEEYSHCEVPAGCGGVVLRWVDPAAGSPAILRVALVGGGSLRAWLDGAEVVSSRVVVEPGVRLLALELTGIEAPRAVILIELQRELGQERWGPDRPVLTRSRVGVDWRASPGAPPDERWHELDFDDRSWVPLSDGAALLDDNERDAWRIRLMREAGTEALAIEPGQIHAGAAWIRHRFLAAPLDAEARRRERG